MQEVRVGHSAEVRVGHRVGGKGRTQKGNQQAATLLQRDKWNYSLVDANTLEYVPMTHFKTYLSYFRLT